MRIEPVEFIDAGDDVVIAVAAMTGRGEGSGAPVIAEKDPANYDRAACRWLARFALERQVGLEEIREALAALEQLPDHPPARWVLGDLLA